MGIPQEIPQANISKDNFQTFLKTKGLMDRTINEYLIYLNHFISGLEGEPTKEYINRFLMSKKNNNVVRSFMKNYLYFIGKVELSPPRITGNSNRKVERVEFISREEINKISKEFDNTADPKRNKLMLAISFQGALREDELLNLRPLNFHWKEWRDNKDSILEGMVKGKRNKTRTIYISSVLAEELEAYIEVLKISLPLGEDKNDFKLFSNDGNGIGARRWRQILAKVSLRAIGRNIHPHMLRHSFAMYAKDTLGWTLEKISRYLGHSSLQTTLIYAKTTDPELRQAFEKGFESLET